MWGLREVLIIHHMQAGHQVEFNIYSCHLLSTNSNLSEACEIVFCAQCTSLTTSLHLVSP